MKDMLSFLYIIAATQASVIIISPTTEDKNARIKEITINKEVSPTQKLSINTGYFEPENIDMNPKTDPSTINNQNIPQITTVEYTKLSNQSSEVNSEDEIIKKDSSKGTKGMTTQVLSNKTIVKKYIDDNNPSTVHENNSSADMDPTEAIEGEAAHKNVVTAKEAEAKQCQSIDGNKVLTALQKILKLSAQGQLSPLFF